MAAEAPSVHENKGKALGSFFSSFTSSIASTTSKVNLPDINKRLNSLSETFQQHARDLPKNLSLIPEQLSQERDQFLKSKSVEGKQHSAPGSELSLPWQGYGDYEPELKQRILAVAKDDRNLIVPPPTDTSFEFDLKAYSQSARAMLNADKSLSALRFVLVPQQLTEETFWRNYFYRVTIVKQQVLGDLPPNNLPKADEPKDDVLFDFAAADSDNDDQGKSDDTLATVTSGSEPVMVDADTDGMEDWERELRREAADSS
ncbi:hypothetical protein DM01DRAFT_1371004 [Hesseltinella vesiculosa]|uniref:BSD domain-containing protein n=1 Tax=Hesseltinella vesiculosa TaxID=101127 RepID=A0A1X2GSI6_9FUNG|nr:hypothetical protein DM01DRAFT_1371004 [Hesseltinella vesiculosa]